ncbi:MAG TPA: rhodanese-like domain-containing protein [Pyrinomonadaceae bacterium]
MRYRILLSIAVLLVLALLTGGVAGQTKKGKTKKRYTSRTKQTTVTRREVAPPSTATSSPSSSVTQPQTEGDGVRRITPEEAHQAMQSGKAVIVDVRGEESFKAGHIKGARWIPSQDLEARAKELPRDKVIITYCS